MKEFKKLLIEYKTIIDLGYDISSSKDYTPDYMTYDYRGFIETYEELKEENNQPYFIDIYMPKLRDAVKHARKYKKWLTSEYNYTFG